MLGLELWWFLLQSGMTKCIIFWQKAWKLMSCSQFFHIVEMDTTFYNRFYQPMTRLFIGIANNIIDFDSINNYRILKMANSIHLDSYTLTSYSGNNKIIHSLIDHVKSFDAILIYHLFYLIAHCIQLQNIANFYQNGQN